MAICAWEIVRGVVSINGKTAPVPKPESMELATTNWLSSPCADAFLVGKTVASAMNTTPTARNT
jgi:hypothetical protein